MKRKRCTLSLGILPALVAILVAVLLRPPPAPSDPSVRALSQEFQGEVRRHDRLRITNTGALQHSLRTLVWGRFETKFGSNPNTPYMYNTLPLARFWFPLLSPMWNVRDPRDAVVLISRTPPGAEYFSFTLFALWIADGRTGFPFSSLGDSLNHRNMNRTDEGLFAHVATASSETAKLVGEVLVRSGMPESAINVAPIPSRLAPLGSVWGGGTFFEVVLRIFKFQNQTRGEEYLTSHPPVFYVKGDHDDPRTLPTSYYKDRSHPDNLDETKLFEDGAFHEFGRGVVDEVGRVFRREFHPTANSDGTQQKYYSMVEFAPLMIRGLDCLEKRQDCLGDCPDAAYFGTNIREDSDDIPLLKLNSSQLHVVTLVNHRALNTSIYSSVAILTPSSRKASTLSKSKMDVRGTSLGVTSFDFENDEVAAGDGKRNIFASWAFTRNPVHCDRLRAAGATDGCTVVRGSDVSPGGHMAYCERMYLNPATGLGPDWKDVLPARLYALDLERAPLKLPSSVPLYDEMKFPNPIRVGVYHNEPFRLLHIVKTGGESLQNYLDAGVSPNLSFETCRAAAALAWSGAAVANNTASPACLLGASAVSSALCSINCECCARDILSSEEDDGGFHGTLIRSPRAHALSLFSHGHAAHHTTWRRILADYQLYLAEGLLRLTEFACGSYCAGSSPNWSSALEQSLSPTELEQGRPLRVLPLRNTQSHALTCSRSRGSMGQHFRVAGADTPEPSLEEALSSLRRMEWVGITDLMEPSICLLHYQANGTLPPACDCDHPRRWAADRRPLGHWEEYRSVRRDPGSLSPEVLARLDDRTSVDRRVFAEAVRLLLGRLRRVELETGSEILGCVDWREFRRATDYIPELWQPGLAGSLL